MSDSSGIRALGIAESTRGDRCTVAGAVVRADRVVDGAAFESATVGGLDFTDAIVQIVSDLEREDLHGTLVGAIAPAWFNVLDMDRLAAETDLPTIAVTFEASDGLEPALRDAFDGEALADRLDRYRNLPARSPFEVGGERVYLRSVGLSVDEREDLVRAFTPEGGRPEPVRVARELARAGSTYRARFDGSPESR
ncbi:DUF99 family protein [Halovivax gelatinilyticus]|uniref:endonuclease dU n=1 Tax=Halovivax gelatinilyticus TaxID=2961597 RepID=UPI0020CA4B41|nr:DUF99 family protein [Halovivax gelatinilyticus]